MNRIYSASYGDYLLSLTGACLIAFGLGVIVGDALGNLGWALVILGVLMHGWGMYRSHRT